MKKLFVVSPSQLAISWFLVKRETKNQYFRDDIEWGTVVRKYIVPTMMWKRFYFFTESFEEAKNYLLKVAEERVLKKEKELEEERKLYDTIRLEIQKPNL